MEFFDCDTRKIPEEVRRDVLGSVSQLPILVAVYFAPLVAAAAVVGILFVAPVLAIHHRVKIKTISKLITRADREAFTTLPDLLGALPRLETVIIEGSKLKKLPDSFSDSRSLRHLHLKSNQELVEVPEGMPSLETLSLRGESRNAYVPTELATRPGLRVVKSD